MTPGVSSPKRPAFFSQGSSPKKSKEFRRKPGIAAGRSVAQILEKALQMQCHLLLRSIRPESFFIDLRPVQRKRATSTLKRISAHLL